MFYRAGSLAAFAQALEYLLFLALVLAVLPAQGGIQVAFSQPGEPVSKSGSISPNGSNHRHPGSAQHWLWRLSPALVVCARAILFPGDLT